MRLLGVFGISNFITGIMLILIAFKARGLALAMLFFIPFAYTIGMVAIRFNSAEYEASQAVWGGMTPMLTYLVICFITFLAGIIGTLYNKSNQDY